MKNIVSSILAALLFVLLIGPMETAQANTPPAFKVLAANPTKIDPALNTELKSLQADEMITVIVQLRQRAILPDGKGLKRAERLARVIDALKKTSDGTQGPMRIFLRLRKRQGKVQDFTPLWVMNGFSVTANTSTINEIASQPDVLSITPDTIDIVPVSNLSTLSNPETNISLVAAPLLWDMGYTGQGIVVATMDSGVDLTHPELSSRWRGGANSWYDPFGQHPTAPFDASGHGTWTMGVILAGDTGGTSVGVAPGAQWIAVKMFNDQGASTATAIHLGFQWLLDPDNDPLTTDAPLVVNNSWAYGAPGCNLEFEPDLQSLRAAGILPVFAAGNSGPSAGTSHSPANNPSAFAVGAVNSINSNIYSLSSRGPTTCGGTSSVFPDLVAPGVNINSTDLGGYYTTSSGTSMSAPHVAGGLALLLSAYPNLTVSQQETALISSAVDLGISGPDDIYGYGRLNLLTAFQLLATPPTDTPTPTSTSTTVPYATDTPTPLPTETPAGVPTFTSTPLPTDMPTPTPLPTFTSTPLPIDTPTPLPTFTSTPLPTDTPTPTPLPTFTSTPLPTDTPTPLPTITSTPLPTNTPTLLPTFTATSTFTNTPTPLPTFTATRTPTTVLRTFHIGDLDKASVLVTTTSWKATVTIYAHNTSETPLSGVKVNISWSGGATGTTSCTTNTSGYCSVSKSLSTSKASITLTVTNATKSSYTYSAISNHDPDGESSGTVILISRP